MSDPPWIKEYQRQYSLARSGPGRGRVRAASRALDILTTHAEAGDTNAMMFLAFQYRNRDTTFTPYSRHLERMWLRRAADAGNDQAQTELGEKALQRARKLGRQKGRAAVEEAIAWFKRAAQSGYVGADWALYCLFDQGGPGGLLPDQQEADYWFKQLALNGEKDAAFVLGRQALDAGGCSGKIEAYAWFWLAIRKPEPWDQSTEAREARELTAELSREEMLDGKRLAYEWLSHMTAAEPRESGTEGEAPWRYHAEAHRIWYWLEEARRHADASVIFEGDTGGQVYLTCPLHLVKCDQAEMRQLLEDVDGFFWNYSPRFYFDNSPPGSGIWGGMGGGRILENQLWVHPDVAEAGLRDEIWAVLSGQKNLMDIDAIPKRV